jgi:hypothetical protein
MIEPEEFTQDEMERVHEIRGMPAEYVKEALEWWNTEAPQYVKRFVIVTCYYESMMHEMGHADEWEWSDNGEL